MKTGKEFESLVSWINKCLHSNAVVTANDYLIDKETGNKRQIDISIRLGDGPTEFIAIVEVRDRSRPVGVDYLEQVKSKCESVKANMAIIVSKKGFYKSAIKKAEIYGIKLFSVEKALNKNWSDSIRNMEQIKIHSVASNSTMYILDSNKKIINPGKKLLNGLAKGTRDDLLFLDKNGKPFKSLNDIYRVATNSKELLSRLLVGEKNKKPQRIFCSFDDPEKIYFYDEKNNFIPINLVCFIGDFWIEERLVSPEVVQYKNQEDILSEVLKVDIENGKSVEILINDPSSIDKDREMKIRINKKSP